MIRNRAANRSSLFRRVQQSRSTSDLSHKIEAIIASEGRGMGGTGRSARLATEKVRSRVNSQPLCHNGS